MAAAYIGPILQKIDSAITSGLNAVSGTAQWGTAVSEFFKGLANSIGKFGNTITNSFLPSTSQVAFKALESGGIFTLAGQIVATGLDIIAAPFAGAFTWLGTSFSGASATSRFMENFFKGIGNSLTGIGTKMIKFEGAFTPYNAFKAAFGFGTGVDFATGAYQITRMVIYAVKEIGLSAMTTLGVIKGKTAAVFSAVANALSSGFQNALQRRYFSQLVPATLGMSFGQVAVSIGQVYLNAARTFSKEETSNEGLGALRQLTDSLLSQGTSVDFGKLLNDAQLSLPSTLTNIGNKLGVEIKDVKYKRYEGPYRIEKTGEDYITAEYEVTKDGKMATYSYALPVVDGVVNTSAVNFNNYKSVSETPATEGGRSFLFTTVNESGTTRFEVKVDKAGNISTYSVGAITLSKNDINTFNTEIASKATMEITPNGIRWIDKYGAVMGTADPSALTSYKPVPKEDIAKPIENLKKILKEQQPVLDTTKTPPGEIEKVAENLIKVFTPQLKIDKTAAVTAGAPVPAYKSNETLATQLKSVATPVIADTETPSTLDSGQTPVPQPKIGATQFTVDNESPSTPNFSTLLSLRATPSTSLRVNFGSEAIQTGKIASSFNLDTSDSLPTFDISNIPLSQQPKIGATIGTSTLDVIASPAKRDEAISKSVFASVALLPRNDGDESPSTPNFSTLLSLRATPSTSLRVNFGSEAIPTGKIASSFNLDTSDSLPTFDIR